MNTSKEPTILVITDERRIAFMLDSLASRNRSQTPSMRLSLADTAAVHGGVHDHGLGRCLYMIRQRRPTVSQVCIALGRHPGRYLVRRWNWKTGLISFGWRGTIFLMANLSAGAGAGLKA